MEKNLAQFFTKVCIGKDKTLRLNDTTQFPHVNRVLKEL